MKVEARPKAQTNAELASPPIRSPDLKRPKKADEGARVARSLEKEFDQARDGIGGGPHPKPVVRPSAKPVKPEPVSSLRINRGGGVMSLQGRVWTLKPLIQTQHVQHAARAHEVQSPCPKPSARKAPAAARSPAGSTNSGHLPGFASLSPNAWKVLRIRLDEKAYMYAVCIYVIHDRNIYIYII